MSGENSKGKNTKKNVLEGNFDYDKNSTFEQRLTETKIVLEKHPDRIPVQVGTEKRSSLKIEKYKYLVPKDFSVAQFINVIRNKNPKLTSTQAIWLFCEGILPPVAESMGELYNRCKSDDGFLRVVCAEENVFG